MTHQNPYLVTEPAQKQAYESAYNLYRLIATDEANRYDHERDKAFHRGIADAKAAAQAERDAHDAQGLIENA